MIEILKGVAMMIGALVGMITLIAGISLAVFSPLILIVWLIVQVF